MGAHAIRVQDSVYGNVQTLANHLGVPMAQVVSNAVTQYQQQVFFDELDAAFLRLKQDPKAWKETQKERALLEGTLLDDLSHE